MFPFNGFWGDVRREFMQRLLLLFMVLWVPIFTMLCRRAVPMLWRASLLTFLGLRPVGFPPPFSFLIGGFHCYFVNRNYYNFESVLVRLI
jgi:hypothetical protein